MPKTHKKVLMVLAIIIGLALFSLIVVKSGIITSMTNAMDKLNANVTVVNEDKPEIIGIINSSGGEKVNNSVALFVDVYDDVKVKKIEYSFDSLNWHKMNMTTKENIYTGKATFSKNINEVVYLRAINEYNNVSTYKTTKVIIEK